MNHADFSIWMIEYATVLEQTSDAVYSGFARQGQTLPFPFTFTLVQGAGKNILIDCGIDFSSPTKRRMAEGFGLVRGQSPDTVLAKLGLTPADIDVIIPTHAHWDHMGALRAFPNAVVYLQRRERDGWREIFEASDAFGPLLAAMDHDDLLFLDELETTGRLVLLDGEVRDLFPGLHIWTDINGHSHASQMVLLESYTTQGLDSYIAVGDVAYSTDNLTGVDEFPHFIPNTKWAIGGAYSTMQSYERILGYVGAELRRVLIEHDYRTWGVHPSHEFEDGLHVAEVRLAQGERTRLPVIGKEASE